jgi:hypothetical protein
MLGTSTGKVDKQDTSLLQQVGIKKHAPEIISQNKLLLATMDGSKNALPPVSEKQRLCCANLC